MTKRICITVPARIKATMDLYVKTSAIRGKKPNISKSISDLIDENVGEIDIDSFFLFIYV